MSALQPPRINTTDPNQQELSDNSDDHFSSASEGTQSPIPITRVERVDDRALHGEVPGTPAYDQRVADAVPDEIEIVPEGRRSRSATASANRSRAVSQVSNSGSAGGSRPATPGGTPIPKTVVEKVDFKPAYGEVEGTPAKEMRMADAMPDEVRSAPTAAGKRLEGRLRGGGQEAEGRAEVEDETEEGRQAWFRSMWEGRPEEHQEEYEKEEVAKAAEYAAEDDDEDDFGDDFDEFADGDGDEDFGDFDEADENAPPAQQAPPPPAISTTAPDILAGLPPLNLATCTTATEIHEAITPYINAILPNSEPVSTTPPSNDTSSTTTTPFLSDRSLSLWQQLVSPPPMQPPNWTRSRIRRLFLVSLGVPVDLDEILPPSKQKRLILPYAGLEGARPSAAIERLREGEANDSTTSLDSKTGQPKPSKQRRTGIQKGPPPPPEFDTNGASLLASTTEEALSVYSDEELKEHVFTLEVLNQKASQVLEYWLQRKDEGIKEKEALEGVIENLVGFVKGRRKVAGK